MTIDEKLDSAVRDIVKRRDSINGQFKCISTGDYLPLCLGEVGHFIPRQHKSVRWNLNNVHLESIAANRFNQDHLDGYRRNLIQKIGLDQVEELERLKNTTLKLSKREKEELLKELKLKLKEYD